MHDSISPDIYNKYDVIYTTCLCYLKFYMVKYMCVREKFIYIYIQIYIYINLNSFILLFHHLEIIFWYKNIS